MQFSEKISYLHNLHAELLSMNFLISCTSISGLATLEINTYDGDFGTYELSEVEMDMFKQLLLEMDGMDRVTIHKISVSYLLIVF